MRSPEGCPPGRRRAGYIRLRRRRWVTTLLLLVSLAGCAGAEDAAVPTIACEGCDPFADGRGVVRLRAGRATTRWPWQAPAAREIWWFDAQEGARLGVTRLQESEDELLLRAGTVAGELVVRRIGDPSRERTSATPEPAPPGAALRVRFHPDPSDADRDGLPDVAELLTEEERAGFSAWFTTIAEAQHTAIDDRWATLHQDCAGLVRFAFREAMRAHDASWLRRWRFLPTLPPEPSLPFHYPALPWLGELPFRQSAGVFAASASIEAHFTAAPSARTLWLYNSAFITREVADAKAGDLLFFQTAGEGAPAMHTMVALGSHPGSTHRMPATRVVYHTGLAGEAGEVRLVAIPQLLAHPDPAWRPTPHNPRFLGVYRLHHLVHAPAESDALRLRPLPRGA